VESCVEELVIGGRQAAYTVVRQDGAVMGQITHKAGRAHDRGVWASTPIETTATPLDRVPVVAPTSTVAELLAEMGHIPEGRALVMEDDRLIGIVSPSDIARLVTAVELSGRRPVAPSV
jgi:hypothetical protein